MAKPNLPSVDVKPGEIVHPATASSALQQIGEAYREHIATEGYVSRRIDAKLTRAAAVKLRDKLRQLQDDGAKTLDGRFVTNKTQAIQWIIENEVMT